MNDIAKITIAFVIGAAISSFLVYFDKTLVYNEGWQAGIKFSNQQMVRIGLDDNDPCAIRIRKDVLAEMVTTGVQTGYIKCREAITKGERQ